MRVEDASEGIQDFRSEDLNEMGEIQQNRIHN